MTLRTLNYGNYGIFLIMGNAGFCPSTVITPASTLREVVRPGAWQLSCPRQCKSPPGSGFGFRVSSLGVPWTFPKVSGMFRRLSQGFLREEGFEDFGFRCVTNLKSTKDPCEFTSLWSS